MVRKCFPFLIIGWQVDFGGEILPVRLGEENKKAIFCFIFKKGSIYCHITGKISLPKS
jgi:hypothetical protein